MVVGIGCACSALTALAFADRGWIVFAIMPLFALSGIGTPAFRALATRRVDPARQGQLQGVLASMISLASAVAPLAFSTVDVAVQKGWPGAVWLSVAAVNAGAAPIVLLVMRADRTVPRTVA